MDTHRQAELGFLVLAASHVGFVTVNLALFGQPGYAFASGLLAAAAVLSAASLHHGWQDHSALLAWSTVAAAAVSTLRWAVAEVGQPLDATSPLAFLLPVASVAIASAGWSLWRGFMDPGGGRALRRLAWGAALLAIADLGFAGFALAAGGLAIGLVLLLAGAGALLVAWGAHRAAASALDRPAARRKTPESPVRNG